MKALICPAGMTFASLSDLQLPSCKRGLLGSSEDLGSPEAESSEVARLCAFQRPREVKGQAQQPVRPGNSPIDDELVVGGRLVANGAHPGGLLLIHLEVEDGVEALQVGAGLRPAGHREPHLHELGGAARGVSRLRPSTAGQGCPTQRAGQEGDSPGR